MADAYSYYETVNGAYFALMGHTHDEVLGIDMNHVYLCDQHEAIMAGRTTRFATQQSDQWEYTLLTESGDPCTVLARSVAVTGSDGQPHWLTFVMDITARTQMEVVVEQWIEGGAGPDAGPGEEAGAALDHGVLATLHELEQHSQPGLLRRVVALYLQEAPAQLAALREAVAHGDAGRVEQEAHALKGSSAQLGAARLARLCAALQAVGARQELGQAAAQVAALQREFVRVRAALEAMLRGGNDPCTIGPFDTNGVQTSLDGSAPEDLRDKVGTQSASSASDNRLS